MTVNTAMGRGALRLAVAATALALVAGCVAPTTQGGVAQNGQAAAPAAWPTADTPMTTADYIEIQSRLAQLGYNPGPADGLPGGRTRRAVADYQRDIGVTPDGLLTDRLVVELREDTGSLIAGAGGAGAPATQSAAQNTPAAQPANTSLFGIAIPTSSSGPGSSYDRRSGGDGGSSGGGGGGGGGGGAGGGGGGAGGGGGGAGGGGGGAGGGGGGGWGG